MNAKSRRQVPVTWSGKSFGHDVRQHHRCLAILELYFTALDLITDVMILDVDVLGTSMIYGVLRHLDARLVVLEDDKLRSYFVGSRQNLA